MSENRFGFIGAGNMAGAIINSILSKGYIKPSNIYIYDISAEKCASFSKCGVGAAKSIAEVCGKSDYIFLCVKPQAAPDVLKELSKTLNPDKCIITIMAGLSISAVSDMLSGHKKIVRIMPNTPLMVGSGAAALVHIPEVNDGEFETVKNIFELSGKSVVVEEDMLSAVTALSGSGPAYFFKFAEAALCEAVELGLEYDTALTLLAQTMTGSAQMLLKSGKTPGELVKMVTSPHGTTEAANNVFDALGYEDIIKKAVKACYDRSVELGKL